MPMMPEARVASIYRASSVVCMGAGATLTQEGIVGGSMKSFLS